MRKHVITIGIDRIVDQPSFIVQIEETLLHGQGEPGLDQISPRHKTGVVGIDSVWRH